VLDVHETDDGDDKLAEVGDDYRLAFAASWPKGRGAT